MNPIINKQQQQLVQQQADGAQSSFPSPKRSDPAQKVIYYKSLEPGQGLSEADKEEAKDNVVLSKMGEQIKVHLCYEGEWQEIESHDGSWDWLGKARKIVSKDQLQSLVFEPQLKNTHKFDSGLVDQLKNNIHTRLDERKNQKRRAVIQEKQPPHALPKQTTAQPTIARRKKGAHKQNLMFFGEGTPSSEQSTLSTPEENLSVARERAVVPGAPLKVLNPVVSQLPPPPKKTADDAELTDDATSKNLKKSDTLAIPFSATSPSGVDERSTHDSSNYYCLKRLPEDATFTFGNKQGVTNKPKIPTTTHPAASQFWANSSDVGSLADLKRKYEKESWNRDYIIRAIYYWVLRAFVNKGINSEQEPALWKLRNFLIHDFYSDIPWKEIPEKEKFLLHLAQTLSEGKRPSTEALAILPQSIKVDPKDYLKIMNEELLALKGAFKPFVGGALEQAFFPHHPEFLGSCYASLIVIVECYHQLIIMGAKFVSKETKILAPCRYQIRNKAVHESDEQLLIPQVDTLYKACSKLYERNNFQPRLSIPQETYVHSNRSHCSSQPLSPRLG